MTQGTRYRIADNFIQKYGVHRLREFFDRLNAGASMESIAEMLHVSVRRAYVYRDALFDQRYGISEATERAINDYCESANARMAVAQQVADDSKSKLRLIWANQTVV